MPIDRYLNADFNFVCFFFTFAVAHPNTSGSQDTFWKEVPKIVVLSPQTWVSFDRQRISCQQKRIAKGSLLLLCSIDWITITFSLMLTMFSLF